MTKVNYSTPYASEKKLHSLIIRVNKNDSVFVYFTLEANEGICFYSTLEALPNTTFRDITIHCTPEYFLPLQEIIEGLKKQMALDIIEHKVVDDDGGIRVP
ncbi:MAG: hypothetical protein ACOYL6_00560 [Bacteriovoracaceae bacterium]